MLPNYSTIFELEREILAAVCNIELPETSREHAMRALAKYEWTLPDHHVIYEALRRSGHPGQGEIRERLKAEVTRLGFPDIEWALYFETSNRTAGDIVILIRELLNAAPGTRSESF
jgi:hypothetical protein